jgi:mono/diheme cytochrome c family protein
VRAGLAGVVGSGIVALGLLGATVLVYTAGGRPPAAPPPAVAAAPTTTPLPTLAPTVGSTTPPTPRPAPTPAPTLPRTPTAVPAPVLASVDGRTLFQRKGCIGCHSVSAAGLKSQMGFAPELSALAQIAAQRRPPMPAEAYVRESIRLPQAYRVPGFADFDMPSLPVSDAELDALVTFLLSDHR